MPEGIKNTRGRKNTVLQDLSGLRIPTVGGYCTEQYSIGQKCPTVGEKYPLLYDSWVRGRNAFYEIK